MDRKRSDVPDTYEEELPTKKRSKNPFHTCLHVDTVDGNDANPGTKEQPLKTFEAVQARIAQLGSCPGVHIMPKEVRQNLTVFACGVKTCKYCKFVNAKKVCPNCQELISSAAREHVACGWRMSQEQRQKRTAKSVKPSTKKTLNASQTLLSIARLLNTLSDQLDAKWTLMLSIPGAARNKGHLIKTMASQNNTLVDVDDSNNIIPNYDSMMRIAETPLRESHMAASQGLQSAVINFMHVELGKKKFQQRIRRDAPQQGGQHRMPMTDQDGMMDPSLAGPDDRTGAMQYQNRVLQAPQHHLHHQPGPMMMMYPPASQGHVFHNHHQQVQQVQHPMMSMMDHGQNPPVSIPNVRPNMLSTADHVANQQANNGRHGTTTTDLPPPQVNRTLE